jgi:excisionase family DNA binding protein
MAATKAKSAKKSSKTAASKNGVAPSGEVLTLAEAAAYLRVSEDDVLHAVSAEGLPGRQFGAQWRFLKTSLEEWLNRPVKKYNKEALLALSGAWKDDPYIDEMLKEIYKKRGRPMTEDGE